MCFFLKNQFKSQFSAKTLTNFLRAEVQVFIFLLETECAQNKNLDAGNVK